MIITAEKGTVVIKIYLASHLATPERIAEEQRIANWRAEQLSKAAPQPPRRREDRDPYVM